MKRAEGTASRRIVYVVSSPLTAQALLDGQLAYLRRHGFDVYVACAPGPGLDEAAAREGVTAIPIPIERRIYPGRDLVSLIRLCRMLRKLQPEIVNAGTTKAGLLGMLAAWLMRIPVRIYVLRGLRLETTRGLKRRVLAFTEWLSARCATRVLCVSRSLADLATELRLIPGNKVTVLAKGSSNGVNLKRFRPPASAAERRRRKEELGIPADARVIGFVGRLARDKGIGELLQAFARVSGRMEAVYLLLVGAPDADDPIGEASLQAIAAHQAIVHLGHVRDTAPFYHAMDVLAFPSYREGFPNAVLEAGASAVPVVGYAATGTVDAVEQGGTGLLVPIGDVEALAEALVQILSQPDRRMEMAGQALERVRANFEQERIWEALCTVYEEGMATSPGTWDVVPSRAA